MNREVVRVPGAAAPRFPYSEAIKANGLVFVSGHTSADLATGEMRGGDMRTQTRQVLENVRRALEAAGSGMDQLVKTTVFVSDIGQFAAMNEVYVEFVPEPFPARSCVEAKLARPELLVEIEAVALA
jgi:2-iminobutanoate/2-iminopropanoate deaminase